jgi:hypothetical protein
MPFSENQFKNFQLHPASGNPECGNARLRTIFVVAAPLCKWIALAIEGAQ